MDTQDETTVVETPAGAGSEPTTDITPENVPSTEVKPNAPVETVDTTVTPARTEDGSTAKMQTQIDNLNTALKQERESGKTASKELADKLSQSQETIDKLKNVFSPEQVEEKTEEGLTTAQLEELLDRRDAKKREEDQKEIQSKTIKEEVSSLEKEWDGEDGKPKYDDKKVLEWQEQNSKMHLSPREAFNEMGRDTIIDWEIKNRMAKKPEVQTVETPGGTPTTREPESKTPKNTEDLRSAVMEAMSSNEQLN